MFYSTLLSLALAATTEAVGPHKGRGAHARGQVNNLLGGAGGRSNGLRNKGLLNKLPIVGPVVDRINVPGRPKWPGEGNSATSPEYPYLFAAPLSQAARTVDALRAKVESEGPVAESAAPAPAAEETPAEAPAEATDVAEGGDAS